MSKRSKSPSPVAVGVKAPPVPDYTKEPPFETKELRRLLADFFNVKVTDPITKQLKRIGSYRWGVYAFYDYDGEPIYVGQTYESLSGRIRRHLTNQRTDAVAMSVLDPFEVLEIAVWPLPEYEKVSSQNASAKAHLNALEYAVYDEAIQNSKFGAILNEKVPPTPTVTVTLGQPIARGSIVSDEVKEIREHPDTRIARRAATLARLAQVINERQVKSRLRRVLLTQAERLQWLADRRLKSLSAVGALDEDDNE